LDDFVISIGARELTADGAPIPASRTRYRSANHLLRDAIDIAAMIAYLHTEWFVDFLLALSGHADSEVASFDLEIFYGERQMKTQIKQILVTGGAGFLGSHLCDRLLTEGHHVLCVDNFFTGNRDNISHLVGNPRFELLRHDVTFPLYVEVDEIYNLACPASPVHYQHDPVQTIKTSVHGAINMLGLAKRTGAKILQASTSEVYGDPEVHPQPESYWGRVNPIGIRSCYDEGKRCAETLFFDYHRQHQVRIKVVRIFNTYGPRMHPQDGRVVSNFIVQALEGRPITVHGDGSQTRSFCYVDDLIEGIIRMMNSPDEFTGPMNLGNSTEFTMLELAQEVLRLTGSSSKLHFLPQLEDDPRRRKPVTDLAQHMLKWKPDVQLQQGLARTIAYFRSLM
jgi:UDP-glucuronate decarboxylase